MLGGHGPIYQQIAQKIKDDILIGTLNEDEQVMSTNQLAAFYQVNPATVAKGFHLLLAEGILYKKRGLGMFVRPGAREKLRSERRERFFEEVVDPMLLEATRIGIPIDEVLEHIQAMKGGRAMDLEIDVRNLRVRYGRVEALKDISFRLSGGKIYGLLGPNGSGKTSLLSVLAGFRRASSGRVTVGGEDTFENRRVMRQICFIRDTVDVDEDETVRAAFRFAARWRPNWDAAYAESLARRFDLPLDRRVSALSRGKRSALGIVLGLASRSPITIFDDAHLGLDVPSRYTFYESLLEEYMARPRTMILASHLIAEMEHLLEEVVIIDGGRLVVHQEADALRAGALTVTGPAGAVDRFVGGRRVLAERTLGGTKQVVVQVNLGDRERHEALQAGLELGSVTLQDLFVHLVRNQEVAL